MNRWIVLVVALLLAVAAAQPDFDKYRLMSRGSDCPMCEDVIAAARKTKRSGGSPDEVLKSVKNFCATASSGYSNVCNTLQSVSAGDLCDRLDSFSDNYSVCVSFKFC